MALVVVSGAIANKHGKGGEAWVRLSWALGLERLGCDVRFVEQIGEATCVDASGERVPFEQSVNRSYFASVIDEFGLRGRASLVHEQGERTEGLGFDELLELAAAADLLVNISGHLELEPLLRRFRRKAYVDLDPGFTQLWHAMGEPGSRLEGHDVYFTVGENIGSPGCPIPTGDIDWRPLPPPVVLDHWRTPDGAAGERFTTVGSWRGAFGPIEYGGRTYGLKVHEFRKVIELPERVPLTFEIALDIHPADAADLQALHAHGWRIVDPRAAAASPAAFRRYVHGSGAEFSVAQGMYVTAELGWVSDRTVRYLASGRPALVQETGFSRNYPVGDGLIAFRTLDEAADGARAIRADPDHHGAAARELAERYFDSDRVLARFLDEAGVAP